MGGARATRATTTDDRDGDPTGGNDKRGRETRQAPNGSQEAPNEPIAERSRLEALLVSEAMAVFKEKYPDAPNPWYSDQRPGEVLDQMLKRGIPVNDQTVTDAARFWAEGLPLPPPEKWMSANFVKDALDAFVRKMRSATPAEPEAAKASSPKGSPADPATVEMVAEAYAAAVKTRHPKARQLDSRRELDRGAADILAHLQSKGCADRETVEAWCRHLASGFNPSDAERYGVRIRQMLGTWPRFRKFRPKSNPEGRVEATDEERATYIRRVLDSVTDRKGVSPEAAREAAGYFGLVIAGMYLRSALGSGEAAIEMLDRGMKSVNPESQMGGIVARKVYRTTCRYYAKRISESSGFMQDWKRRYGWLFEPHGLLEESIEPDERVRDLADGFMQRLASQGSARLFPEE